jgi:DNA-binding MarR family transcriptional regulator
MRAANIIAQAVYIEAVRTAGLTPRQAHVLAAIAQRDVRSQVDLASAAGVDRTTLSKICRRLIRKGLVRRRRVPHDTRCLVAALTPEGIALLAQVQAAARQAEQAAQELVSTIERYCMGPFARESAE